MRQRIRGVLSLCRCVHLLHQRQIKREEIRA